MSFRSFLGDLIKGPATPPATTDDGPITDPQNMVKQGIFSNLKLIVLVAFVALLAWNATNKLFTGENMADVKEILKLFIIVEGVIHFAVVVGNVFVKIYEVKAFMADGKIDDNETKVLGTQVNVSTEIPTIPTTPAKP